MLPDGTVRWIHDRATAFESISGRRDRAARISEDVTEKKSIETALKKEERGRRAAALAAEQAEARERRALAVDLHDSVSQSLALARTKLAALRAERDSAANTSLPEEPENSDWVQQLRSIESLIAEADERTRTLTFRLSPPILHDLGLTPAVEWLGEDLMSQFGLKTQINEDGEPMEPLTFEIREALFRSIRELLINVARHAQTNEANLHLSRDGDVVTIAVADGGVGFDVGASGAAGFGLVSIRERMEALGGRLEIDSEAGRGTRARLIAPAARID